MSYPKEQPYSYARGYYRILPDDSIYFSPDTPEDIKERFTKEWAEHLKKRDEERSQGIWRD